jgi:hypothetical protein
MSRVSIALLALVIGLAGAVGGFFYGHHTGEVAEAAKRDGQAVKDLTGLIDSHKDLIKTAGAASKAMRGAIAQRAAQDAQTTKEFKDALTVTADSRAGCVFPDDVMRQLAAARERAAEAAAFGVRGAMPGASGPASQPRR